MNTDAQWVAMATEYYLGKSKKHQADVIMRKMPQLDGSKKWTVRMNDTYCLGKDLNYYQEYRDRSDEFLAMCRFDTKQQAYDAWIQYENTPKRRGYPGWLDVKHI